MLKEILINIDNKEKRVALLEDKRLEEFYIERDSSRGIFGNIYKGKVKTIIPGIEAAFVDLGLKKDGFLYIADAVSLPEEYKEAGQAAPKKDLNIKDVVHKGQEILVQVIKEPIGTKGVRLTTRISLPSRNMVLVPGEEHIGVSRRIESEAERNRLKITLQELKLPKGMSFIIRTAARGKTKRELARDVKYLIKLWKKISAQSRRSKVPSLVHSELDLVLSIIRDSFTEDVANLLVDNRDEYKRIFRFARSLLPPAYLSKIKLYQGANPLFEEYNIEREIKKIFKPTAYLKSGGHIIIEQTEGLVVVDVNTGRFTGKKGLEDTVFKTNCQAASEIARQARLRNIGGIIVIDFIDMDLSKNRKKVIETLKEALSRDKAKVEVLPVSEIGLVEMTRQRTGPSLADVLYDPCPYCQGSGSVKSIISIAIEVLRQIRGFFLSSRYIRGKTVIVITHPRVRSRLLNEDKNFMVYLERKYRTKITINENKDFHLEEIKMQ
ncbi:MAG: Rne/Rng family ribonuclease [Candidatus Omnitrophota bacterium]|nr:Rne/Rng family ribonuclease [Candidatus Omnitrophota bacterium]